MKVCLIVQSLGQGGAERSTANLSIMLTDLGYDVHIICLVDNIKFDYQGTLLNLGAEKSEGEFKLWHRGRRFLMLRRYLNKHHFKYVIDNRIRKSAPLELLYLLLAYRGCRIVYVVRSYRLANYFPSNKLVSTYLINRAYSIVGVSKQIAERINTYFATNKAKHIYNPISTSFSSPKPNTIGQYLLYLGRFEDVAKNFSLLLEAYIMVNKSIRPKLVLQGDGPDKEKIMSKIMSMGLAEEIIVKPFDKDVVSIIVNAYCLVLASRYEGFPRVLIEALSYGTPVVSVDCKSGPSEIIINEMNGLIVENYNEKALAKAMERMITDKELYRRCKANAVSSVKHLSPDIIGQQWKKLLEVKL